MLPGALVSICGSIEGKHQIFLEDGAAMVVMRCKSDVNTDGCSVAGSDMAVFSG